MLNISFDFDDTLFFKGGIPNFHIIQRLNEHEKTGYKVFVVSRRFNHSDYNGLHTMQARQLVYKHCGYIPFVCTQGEDKWHTLAELSIHFHYDDADFEIHAIHSNTPIRCYKVAPKGSTPPYYLLNRGT